MVKPAKKATAEEADKRILDYMRRVNRPYSAVDVFNNMKQEIGKTQVQKSLLQLVEDGHLTMKLNGKQQAFVIRQDTMEEVSQEEMAEMDGSIAELKQNVQEKKELIGLATLLSSLTDDQIRDRLEGLTKQNEKNTEKLKQLREGGIVISDEDRKAVDVKYEESRKQWRLRKRIFKDIIDTITEPMEMKPRVLMEELGLEADEDAGHDYSKDFTAYLPSE